MNDMQSNVKENVPGKSNFSVVEESSSEDRSTTEQGAIKDYMDELSKRMTDIPPTMKTSRALIVP